MTIASMEANVVVFKLKLQQILYIQYLIQFGQYLIKAFIDFVSKVNTIQLSFIKKLGLRIRKTNVGAQKIDGNRLKTFNIVIASFLVENKDGRSRLFEGTFLLANINMNVVFDILFLILNNVKINFPN